MNRYIPKESRVPKVESDNNLSLLRGPRVKGCFRRKLSLILSSKCFRLDNEDNCIARYI